MERRKAGGGAGDAATVSSGEVQLGQTVGDAARAGVASARAGSGGTEVGVARGRVLSGAETAGAAHMAGRTAAVRGREEQRRGREVDEEGPG
jgi:hypothetical protein